VEEACTQILAFYADRKSNVFRTSDVEAAVALLEERALEEETVANGTSLSAQIGEVLAGRGTKKLDDLLRDWDPNGDGSVTKQEFRVCVRKLFKKPPDTRETDALFAALDSDGGGELNMEELKSALKKMIAAHNNRKATHAIAMAKVTTFHERAKALREGSIASAVRASEAACLAFQEVRKLGSLGSQLGEVINSKGMKASDVATKWDASGDGELDKKEFRANVLKLLPSVQPAAIDEVFDSLDADGGGSLDIAEVRKALKRFQEESAARLTLIKTTGLELIAKFKACRRAQAEHKAQATIDADQDQKREQVTA